MMISHWILVAFPELSNKLAFPLKHNALNSTQKQVGKVVKKSWRTPSKEGTQCHAD